MDSDKYRKKLTIAGVGAGIILTSLLSFALNPGQPATETVSAKKPEKAMIAKVGRRNSTIKTGKAVNAYRAPASMVPAPDTVQFPKPTEITIVVARNAELVKLDAYQNPLPEDSENWDCVTDRSTGLIWEVKTNDKGLQDANNFYSWYHPDDILNRGDTGLKDNGNCRGGIDCDTRSYTNAVNKKKLCGFSDWRLPTRKELLSLVHSRIDGNQKSMIDTRYFPSASGDWYWTSDTDADDAAYAWYVLFYNGRTMKAPKHQAKRIRLVRGSLTTRPFKHVAENPETHENIKLAIDKHEPQSQELAEAGVLPASNISQ